MELPAVSHVSTVLNIPELLRSILLQAPYDTVLTYCQSYVQAQAICNNNLFWMQKAQQDFNVTPNVFTNTTLSPAQRYLQLLTKNGGIAFSSEQFLPLGEFLRRAIRQNRPDLVAYISNFGFNKTHIFLYEYARQGNRNLVDHFLSLLPTYEFAAEGALEGGHKELFNYIIAKVPTGNASVFSTEFGNTLNWNNLINAAIKSGNRQLFDYVRSLAPLDWRWDWIIMIYTALSSDRRELFDYIRSIAPGQFQILWNNFAGSALVSGNRGLFDYIRTLAPLDWQWDWNFLAGESLRSGNLQLFQYVTSLFPPNFSLNLNLNNLALYSIKSANQDLFDYIRSIAPPNYNWNWQTLIEGSILSYAPSVFNHIISLIPPNNLLHLNWNNLAKDAIRLGNINIFNHILKSAPPGYQWNWVLLLQKVEPQYRELYNYIRSLSS